MQLGILGALEARDGDVAVPLGGVRERSLLAVLLLHAGELVPTEQLVDELWGERPPKTAVKTVQVYVSRLRKLLGAEAIVTSPPGYTLRVDPEDVDLHRFERLCAEGRRALEADDAALARRRLADALALWRGAPLADFAYEPFAQPHAARLDELRLTALEDRIEADLRCGRAAELVGELGSLTARHPLRERLRGQHMLALYRSGRQSEALDVFRDTRTTLVEELGIEPTQELRDLEQAILVHDASLASHGTRPPARAAGIFVGREAELSALLEAAEEARSGRGALFLVAGEPGIGKSRLADELAAYARERGFGVLRGRCWEGPGAPAFWPWAQVLRASLRGAGSDDLRKRLGGHAADIAELLPELRDEVEDAARPAVGDPEGLRFRLFEAVTGFLRSSAAVQPLLIVLDDLHAADESSLLLLEFLTRTVADAPVIVLAAYRDTDVGPKRPLERLIGAVIGEPAVARIALEGLRPADVSAYIESSTGRRAPDTVVEAIHASAAGNPLFVVETIRLMAAEARMDAGALDGSVPAGVREAISRRLQDLPEDSRSALVVASVLGYEFDPDVLERVAGSGHAAGAVDQAIAAKLVSAAPGAPGRLRFSHALVRDALYEAIPAAGRRDLHGRVAVELERRLAADGGARRTELAEHFFRAGAVGPATEHAWAAARQAASQLAFEEAARLYGMALEARERSGETDELRLCDLLIELGQAEARAGRESEAKATFLRAADLARRTRMPERLGRAALGYGGRFVWTVGRGDRPLVPLLEEAIAALGEDDSALRARLLARLACTLKGRGDAARDRRFALTAEAVAMARRLGDPVVLSWCLDARKVAIWAPDTLEEHWAVIDELRELALDAGDPEQLVDAHVCALIALFERFEVSRFDDEHARAAIAARELGQPGQRWLVAVMAPMHALLVGQLGGAEQLIAHARELGRGPAPWNAHISSLLQRFVLGGLEGRLGDVRPELRTAVTENPDYPVLRAALASLYAELDDRVSARAAFEGLAADDFASVPFDEVWLMTTALLADCCWHLRDTARAAALYERLEPYVHRVVVSPVEIAVGSAGRPLGRLAATLGRHDDAARWFAHAARTNERAGALPWAAHARLDHARLLLDRGDQAAAAPLLERALATYRELGMEAWAARGESLAAQSSVTAVHSVR